MNETKFKTSNDFLKFVFEFHKTMSDRKIVLAYEGLISHDITVTFSELAETNVNLLKGSEMVTQRVYHVMVECLQNICKHADDEITGTYVEPGKGIFLVTLAEDGYYVTTGNSIALERVEGLKSFLDMLNKLSGDELKALYRKRLVENRLSEKGDAGLGLVDIAKKTGQKIKYLFTPINDKTSFFLLSINVKKN